MAYLVPLIEYLSHYSLTIKKIKREIKENPNAKYDPGCKNQ